MALKYDETYSGSYIPGLPEYPYGKPRNIRVLGSRTGSAREQDTTNDTFGLLQALLLEANRVPSGVPDTALASDYLDSLIKTSRATFVVSNWISRPPAASITNFSKVTYSESLGLFIAVAFAGSASFIQTSPNGIDWTTRTPGSAAGLSDVTHSESPDLVVAVGLGPVIESSADGINWTARTPAVGTGQFNGVGVGLFIGVPLFAAVGSDGGSAKIETSADGITWTARTPAAATSFGGIVFSPPLGIFCAVGINGGVETSIDGITWVAQTSVGTTFFQDVDYSPERGIFCAVGLTGIIETSPDGVVWTRPTTGTTQDLASVAWSAQLGLFVVVGETGTVLTSPDGVNWTTRIHTSPSNINGVIYSQALGIFTTVGSDLIANSLVSGL